MKHIKTEQRHDEFKMTFNEKVIFTILNLSMLLAAGFFIWRGTPNTDTYWMVATGEYIVQNREIPTINPFVIHDNMSIIIQQYTYDILIYLLYTKLGNFGLMILCFITYAISCYFIHQYIKLVAHNKYTLYLTTFATQILFAVVQLAMVSRPQSISLINILVILVQLEKYSQTNNKKHLLVLPIISLLEINIHASFFLILFVFMLPYLCIEKLHIQSFKKDITEWIKSRKYIILTMIIMLITGFINPYGIDNIMYLANSYGSASYNNLIEELQKPELSSITGIMCIIAIIMITVYICEYKKNVKISHLTLCAGTIILGSMHHRNLWIVFIGMIPVITSVVNKQLDGRKFNGFNNRNTIIVSITYLLLNILILSAFIQDNGLKLRELKDNNRTPESAVEYLNTLNKDDLVIYNSFNSGGYLEMYGYKVYIDQRPEIYQKLINNKEDIYTEYVEVNYKNSVEAIRKFLEKYHFTHLIVGGGTDLHLYLELQDDYKAIVSVNKSYTLFEHTSFRSKESNKIEGHLKYEVNKE